MNAIETHHLTKRFGGFTAVDDLTFSVRAGEIFGFLGANGAGKTTAMKMLTGLAAPTSGDATVAGRSIRDHAVSVKKRIGYMSQRFSLYEDLSVRENLRFFGGVYGLDDATLADRIARFETTYHMSGRMHTRVKELPLGIKQNVAFGTALLHQPDIVFLDEPTGGVDPITRRRFWGMLVEEAARGTTLFVTTHYMDEAEYCDRIGMMVDGKLVALDTPARLKQTMGVATMDDVFVKLARGGAA